MIAKEKELKSSINLSFPAEKLKEIKKVAIDKDMNTSELLETAYEFYKKNGVENEICKVCLAEKHLYQNKTCKECLSKEFLRLHPIQDKIVNLRNP